MTAHDALLTGVIAAGRLGRDEIALAEKFASERGLSLESVLLDDCGLSRSELARIKAERYGASAFEFDERLEVPPDLLDRFHEFAGRTRAWFPVKRLTDGAVVVAAADPDDETTREEASRALGCDCVYQPALERDVRWLIADFTTRDNGAIIGAERTDLAFWRNTLAQWRTHLACYRTDLAKGRTGLNIMRFGLGLIALANSLIRKLPPERHGTMLFAGIGAGAVIVALGFRHYYSIRRARMRPPGAQTIVEVTAVTLSFLEDFHYHPDAPGPEPTKKTMLGRLGDLLCEHSTVLSAYPAHRPRIHLARERNILAAQRTIGACYRTIASRARTGLSFLRTGVTLTGLGLGLFEYFGASALTVFDALLVAAGIAMICDGVMWYLPVRGEYAQTPRCEADVLP